MHLILTVLGTLVQAVLIVALADFVAGVIHWAEDAYFTENTPIIGPLFIRPNIVHHHHPRFFTRLSWWESSAALVFLGATILLVAWPLGILSWQIGLFVAVGINGNQVHKWAHRTRAENGRIISTLQDWRILQTARHHGLHHSDPKNTYYCPITNFVNPVLEHCKFWERVEAVIEHLTGATHRQDTAVRGQGPGPEWLVNYRPNATSVPTAPRSAHVQKFPVQQSSANHCQKCCGNCIRSNAVKNRLKQAA
jgi:plasmanylethanolamine desaturase